MTLIKAEFTVNPIFKKDNPEAIEKARLQKERMTNFANFMLEDPTLLEKLTATVNKRIEELLSGKNL